MTSDGLIYVEQQRLAQLAQDRSLPLIGHTREMAKWPGMLILMAQATSHFLTERRIRQDSQGREAR